MVVKRNFKCIHCKGEAYEYFGLEGGLYIGGTVKQKCPDSTDNEHDFRDENNKTVEQE